MKQNAKSGRVNRATHLLTTTLIGSAMFMLLLSPVHADALLGVIGYHIVPMQLENEEGQQEEEGDDTSDSDQTTVARDIVSYRQLSNKFSAVSHVNYDSVEISGFFAL